MLPRRQVLGNELVRHFHGGRQVQQPLHLDAVARAHVTNVVEVGRGRNHFRSTIVVPVSKNSIINVT